MVSEKMKAAVTIKEGKLPDNSCVPWTEFLNGGSPEEVAQAVVNSAWTDFDAKDESTWPKDGNKARFYFIIDGYKLNFLSKEELIDLLMKFVRMSDKKSQQKTINEIREILIKICAGEF